MLEDAGRISLVARAPSYLLTAASCPVLSTLAATDLVPSLAWPHPFPLLRKGVWPRETTTDLSGFLSLSIRLTFSDKVVFKFSPIFFGLSSKDFLANCCEYFRYQANRIEVSLLVHSTQRFFCRVSIAYYSDGDVFLELWNSNVSQSEKVSMWTLLCTARIRTLVTDATRVCTRARTYVTPRIIFLSVLNTFFYKDRQ